ncbi:MAG: hypothetical protein ACE5E9_07045 [Nitrospinaceae bacterium]
MKSSEDRLVNPAGIGFRDFMEVDLPENRTNRLGLGAETLQTISTSITSFPL